MAKRCSETGPYKHGQTGLPGADWPRYISLESRSQLNFGEMICTVCGMAKYSIFISSVQKELAEERQALKAYVEGDALLSRFFEVFLFEQLPAADRRADQVYLDQVDQCDLYLGLFGDEYGFEDAADVSPTAREFDRATEQGKTRLIYVKGADDKGRHPKMAALIRKAGDQLIRRRFGSRSELIADVYARVPRRPPSTKSRAKSSAKPLSMPWPIATTPAAPVSR